METIKGNITFKHPTAKFSVTPKFTKDAILLTIKYEDGTVIERYEYKDGRDSEIVVTNRKFNIDLDKNEAYIVTE